jgi:hypothetical protein
MPRSFARPDYPDAQFNLISRTRSGRVGSGPKTHKANNLGPDVYHYRKVSRIHFWREVRVRLPGAITAGRSNFATITM